MGLPESPRAIAKRLVAAEEQEAPPEPHTGPVATEDTGAGGATRAEPKPGHSGKRGSRTASRGADGGPGKRTDVREAVFALLPDTPVNIAKALGRPEVFVYRRLNDLRRAGRVTHGPPRDWRRTVWAPAGAKKEADK